MKTVTTKQVPRRSGSSIRSWLSGAFYALALVSFTVNYCVFSGKLAMQSSQAAQGQQASQAPQGQRDSQISMADLKPTAAEIAARGRR